MIEKRKVNEEFGDGYVGIEVNYREGLRGSKVVVMEERDGGVIGDLMMGGDGRNGEGWLSEIELSGVEEGMKEMMG
ncbi:hypothetical protein [Bacillus altitudinis]|uniref:hypothetical protein n=1 Tax=Bacillus altitudinis TaxID=293387 RepID=UPI0011A4ECF8|nr:hypothetical protein [Bacillus altitudinis]